MLPDAHPPGLLVWLWAPGQPKARSGSRSSQGSWPFIHDAPLGAGGRGGGPSSWNLPHTKAMVGVLGAFALQARVQYDGLEGQPWALGLAPTSLVILLMRQFHSLICKMGKAIAHPWSSHCGSVIMNPTSIHEVVGSIPALAQWVKDPALA